MTQHPDRGPADSHPPATLWELTDVSLGRDGSWRLQGVSTTIGPGRTAVIGPSGAGKTSLLNLLVGFERPDAGRVQHHFSQRAPRLPVAWAPPDFGLWPHLTVREHLEASHPATALPLVLKDVLGSFCLEASADVRPDRLSQGERSRLAVARTLVSHPQVLVLDEPLVHVDPILLDSCWRAISQHCDLWKTSLVFSSHSPERVLDEADDVVCLDEGHLIFAGKVHDLYQNPASKQLALLLGPANWFEPPDCARWLPESLRNCGQPVCLRPAQLELRLLETSPLVVEATTDRGVVRETIVRDEKTRESRTLLHRATGPLPKVQSRVALQLCALFLLCLTWNGCRRAEDGPALEVVATRTLRVPPEGASLPAPRSLTWSADDELYVLDNAGRVLVYNIEGQLVRQWRMPEYDIGKPEGVCVLSDGRVAVADTHYARIVIFDRHGTVHKMFGERGEDQGQFIFPVGIARDTGDQLYVAEYGGNDRIQKFTQDGAFVTAFGSFGVEAGQFQRPSGLVWHDGLVFVADAINNRIQKFTDDGEFLGVLGDREGRIVSLEYPYDIVLGGESTLFAVEYGAGRVTHLGVDGSLLGRYGSAGRGEGQLWTPWGVAFDSTGRLYIADTGNRRVVELRL